MADNDCWICLDLNSSVADNGAAMSDPSLRILLLEDNDALRDATQTFLERHGHAVRSTPSAEEINEACGDFQPDIYIVDLTLPGEDGLSVVHRVRQLHPQVGIVITTARAQIGERVHGYESGADLYFIKPVDPQELHAGILALAKRIRAAQTAVRGVVTLNLKRFLLSGPAGETTLTPTEATLMTALARAPGRMAERWQLLEIMRTGNELPSSANLEMRITRLRRKLARVGAEAPYIKSLHKVGYLLCNGVTLV